jgi:hypothetical protein
MPRTQSARKPISNRPAISLDALREIIDRFGEDPARWPERRRAAAEALLNADPAAQALVAEAQLIRAWLQRRAVKAPEHLLRAIDVQLEPGEYPDMQSGAVEIGRG